MGEDWIRKTEKTWRRSLRRKVEEYLVGPSLLEADEEKVITYPCQLLEPADGICVGTSVVIYQRSPQARIAVLHENHVLGLIEGDAEQDLKTLFEDEPRLCRILKAEVITADPMSRRIELAVANGSRKVEWVDVRTVSAD
jgi:hypothetical protein